MNLKIFGREFSVHSSKLIAGRIFLVMGVVNVLVGLTGTVIPAAGSVIVGAMLAELQRVLLAPLSSLAPEPATQIGMVAPVSMILLVALGDHGQLDTWRLG